MAKKNLDSFFSQEKAIEKSHEKSKEVILGGAAATSSDFDKVKVNLSLIRKNQERLKAEAKKRGVTVSGLITIWIDENCV